MKAQPITAVGSSGTEINVHPGDRWPAPYRGSKYTVQSRRGLILVGWKRDPLGVQADPIPHALAQHVRATKGHNGSFRVTPHGAILTKVSIRGGSLWEPRYVGRYEDDLNFQGLDNKPSDLSLGMYWTGLPFAHGEYWKVSPYSRSSGLLYWSSKGRNHPSTERFPELTELCLDIRPDGGRMYFTESGSIWMNVPDSGLSQKYRTKFQKLQKEQLERMQERGMRAALRLLTERIKATGTRPIYIGQVDSFDSGVPPWTAFSAEPPAEAYSKVDG